MLTQAISSASRSATSTSLAVLLSDPSTSVWAVAARPPEPPKATKLAPGNESVTWSQYAKSLIIANRPIQACQALLLAIDQRGAKPEVAEKSDVTINTNGNGTANTNSIQVNGIASSEIAKGRSEISQATAEAVSDHLLAAKLYLMDVKDYDLAMKHSQVAMSTCRGSFQEARCMLFYSTSFCQKIWNTPSNICLKTTLLRQATENFERTIHMDPHDYLSHFYASLQYAHCRNITTAIEHCQNSLKLNPEQPNAIFLLALLFTATGDYLSAHELVNAGLQEFPNNMGLLVLRFRLEEKYDRSEEVFQAAKALLTACRRSTLTPSGLRNTVHRNSAQGTPSRVPSSIGGSETHNNKRLGTTREAIGPMTPIFAAPLLLAADMSLCPPKSPTIEYPASDNGLTSMSLAAAPSSNVSMTSTTQSLPIDPDYRFQASLWLQLGEFFLRKSRLHDVQVCVEEATALCPDSVDITYFKALLLLSQVKSSTSPATTESLLSQARSYCLTVLGIDTGHISAMNSLAEIYHFEDNFPLAEKCLRDLLMLDHLDHRPWHALGCLLALQERFDEASECFETAAKLETTTPLIPFSVIPLTL